MARVQGAWPGSGGDHKAYSCSKKCSFHINNDSNAVPRITASGLLVPLLLPQFNSPVHDPGATRE